MPGAADPTRDPWDVLGLDPGAPDDEIARAYRRRAKELHPDRAGAGSAPEMAQLNAAYDLLRDGLAEAQRERLRTGAANPAGDGPTGDTAPPPPGHWLTEDVRRRLGGELTAALEPGEQVLATADAATWDSHDVRLAVTDRRLVWLRDDAISDRVRYQRHDRITAVDTRPRGRLRRTAELRVTTDGGRRLRFGELAPGVEEVLLTSIRPFVFQARE